MSQDLVNSYEGGVGKVITQGMRVNKTASQTVLGTIRNLAVGRQIVYAKVGAAAISASTLCQAKAGVAGFGIMPAGASASIGAKKVNLVNTAAMTADQFQDGFLVVQCGTGSGYSYMVDYHLSAAVTDLSVNIALKDGLEVALTTASICSLVENKFAAIIKLPAGGATGPLVGVGLCTGSVNSYVWLGKKGPFLCINNSSAITVGAQLCAGSAAGTVDMILSAALTVNPVVGRAMQSGANSGGAKLLVDLDL
jgi:hypothetical protein